MATATDSQSLAAVRLRDLDNVAVATRSIAKGESVSFDGLVVEAREAIRAGHKMAVVSIKSGEPVRKYGQIIGSSSKDIEAGAWVHVHNLHAEQFERDYAFATEHPTPPPVDQPRTFQGFLRPDGRVGTRNYIAVISTVNCSASTSKYVSDRFRDNHWQSEFPNVDGVLAITHKGGCGLAFEGPDHAQLRRVLAGFAEHPNVGAYVLIGLGCEVGYASHLVESERLVTIGGNGH